MILGGICILLLIWYIRSILAIRSLYMQLGELERGSRMELGAQSRQKDLLALCRKINSLQQAQFQKQVQYEK